MTDWRDKIRDPDCELCPLHEEAEHVCLMGDGTRKAKIMIVGEAPGAREDEAHRAFVGPAGQLLDKLLKEARIKRGDCYITNAAKCRPPSNRTPERKEIKVCSNTYLTREWEKVSPDYVLVLGNAALQAVLSKSGITKHRGITYGVGGAVVLPTFHPAAVLRNPRYGDSLRADLQRFGRLVRGEPPNAEATRVKIIRTPKQLKWLRHRLMGAREISFDIETTGLVEWESDSRIVSIGFSWEEGQGAVVPLHHKSMDSRWARAALQYLKPALEKSDAKYIGHNAKFDCRWLAANGIFVPLTFDTMLAAHMLDENRLKGLKPLSQILLGVDAYDVGEDIRDAYNMPLRRLCVYNAKDTDYTLRLRSRFKEELKLEPRIARVFKFLMMPASNVLTQVERVGIWVDEKRLKKITKLVERKREESLEELLAHVPKMKRDTINFNSHPQVGEWLFNDLKLPVIEKTKKGANSSKESVLLQLAKKHPAPSALLQYRKWTKYLNTYLEPWAKHMDERHRIHATYKLFGTVTGRLSCVDPNLQQVPRESIMRTCFGAPKGWSFVEADYAQIEMRLVAMIADEKNMKRIFLRGEDPHRATALELVRTPDITYEQRKKAKGVNFGFQYGMGEAHFIDYALENYDVEVSEREAHQWRERYFKAYPALRPWHERQRRLVNRYGRVHSPIGRVRHLPDVRSRDKSVRAEAERQAINSPVQSFASDLMLLAMVRLSSLLKTDRAWIVGTVHDAILFQIKDEYLAEALPVIKEVMEDLKVVKKLFGTVIDVPIEAEIKVGSHWGEGEVWTG